MNVVLLFQDPGRPDSLRTTNHSKCSVGKTAPYTPSHVAAILIKIRSRWIPFSSYIAIRRVALAMVPSISKDSLQGLQSFEATRVRLVPCVNFR